MKAIKKKGFTGLQLYTFENRLRYRGTIVDVRVDYMGKGTITFFTETGMYSFYNVSPRAPIRLSDGRWKFFGDYGRWAYVGLTE